ncbi:MAG TPA: hypothetical protein LFW20_06450 [Rickettsia endosymbiont of Omalisus fontisbellaquei]|nr:hypothetical protein [Rickettsia endosymbiont of Omalisus fontisbellaquei]
MSIKSILSVTIISFLLLSCKSYVVPKEASDAVLNNEKALIVFTAIVEGQHSAVTIWKNLNNDVYIPTDVNDIVTKGLWSEVLYTYIIPPGDYTLTTIMSYAIHAEFANLTESTSKVAVNNLMSFSIAKGEVIYLGNITFNYENNKVTYKVIDQFEKIQKEAQEIFPQLSYRLKKRIITAQYNI